VLLIYVNIKESNEKQEKLIIGNNLNGLNLNAIGPDYQARGLIHGNHSGQQS